MLQLFAEEPGGDPVPPNPDPEGKPEVTDPETPPAPEAKYRTHEERMGEECKGGRRRGKKTCQNECSGESGL